jgi:hypothetical protein
MSRVSAARTPRAVRATGTAAVAMIALAVATSACVDPGDAELDPAQPRAVAGAALEPTDNPWIAFVSRQGGRPQVQFVRADGSGLTDYEAPLQSPPDLFEESPAWGPDGTELALVVTSSARVALRILDFEVGGWQDIDQNLEQITSPAWSPDGTQIVVEGRLPGDGTNHIFVIGLPEGGDCLVGQGCTELTNPPAGGADSSPVWAADGTIYFVRRQGEVREVYSVPSDGSSGPTQVTSGSEVIGGLALSADETVLFYTRLGASAADTELVARTLGTGSEAILGVAGDVDLAPFGDGARAVLVRKGIAADSELALVNDATGDLVLRLTADGVGNAAPAVAPVDSAGIDVSSPDCQGDAIACGPGRVQCPSVSPYTGVALGIRPGLAAGELVPWCSASGDPDDLITNYRVELVRETDDDRTLLFERDWPAGTGIVSGAGVVCAVASVCSGGLLDADALTGGDWRLVYTVERQDSPAVVDEFPFARVELEQSLGRLDQGLGLVADAALSQGATAVADAIAETRSLLAHGRAALAQSQDTTVFAALEDVSDATLAHRDQIWFGALYQNLLNTLLSEYNAAATRHVDAFHFAGLAAADPSEAGDAWAQAVAERDASANGNATSALRRAIFHRFRLTDGLAPDFEAGVAGLAPMPPHVDVVALYQDLEDAVQSLLGAVSSEPTMLGEAELDEVADLLDGLIPDLTQYATNPAVMSNQTIAAMVAAQFRLLPLLEAAAAEHLGLFAQRQRAIYGLYAIVEDSIPSAAANIVDGATHPLIVEANRRFGAMSERIEAFLNPASSDHLETAALVDLVLMASAGPGDWATLGGGAFPSPANGLEVLTNACFINAVLISAYVPSGRTGPDSNVFLTDSLAFFPETPVVIFDGCDEATLAGVTNWR